MCGKNDNHEPQPYMVVSEVTLKAICESCIEGAKIEIRTFKAMQAGEYGNE
jgi:hypothetical protein